MKMNNYKLIKEDFKDCLEYPDICQKKFKKYTNLKKWILYDHLRPDDADRYIRDNNIFSLFGWENDKWIDAMFPLRLILTGLIRSFSDSEKGYVTIKPKTIVYNITKIKQEDIKVYDLLDYRKVLECVEQNPLDRDAREWCDLFQTQLDKYAKNVHTIGNYMPCPDGDYNKIKGLSGRWTYNDRLDVLYKDVFDSGENAEWKSWFEENQKELFLTEIFQCINNNKLPNLPVQKHLYFPREQICNLIKWLEIVNSLIEDRSNKIIKNFENL